MPPAPSLSGSRSDRGGCQWRSGSSGGRGNHDIGAAPVNGFRQRKCRTRRDCRLQELQQEPDLLRDTGCVVEWAAPLNTPSLSESSLRRSIGTLALAAGIINTTIGAGIFRLPARHGGPAWSNGAIRLPALRDRDGTHRPVHGGGRQPRLAHRRSLRLCRGRVWALRGIPGGVRPVDGAHLRDGGSGDGARREPWRAGAAARVASSRPPPR